MRYRCVCYNRFEEFELSWNELENFLNNNPVVIIDVRNSYEFKEGHITGAINIPLLDLGKKINFVVRNKNQNILVYCSSGGRSKKAQNILRKLGYSKVYNLKNGISKAKY